MLSLVHWLMYAASVGGKDMNWLAGVYCHGEEAFASNIVAFLKPPSTLYDVWDAGRTAEYM